MTLTFISQVNHLPHLERNNSAISSHGSICACENHHQPNFQNSDAEKLGTRLNNLPTNNINNLDFLTPLDLPPDYLGFFESNYQNFIEHPFDEKTALSAVDFDENEKNFTFIENKLNRYIRQNAARELLQGERVCDCMRKNTYSDVLVKKAALDGKAYFADLFACGSGWVCPVCSAKITEQRRAELIHATTTHTKQYGKFSLIFVTLTYPHRREDNLKLLLEKQAKAIKFFNSHRDYVTLQGELEKVGHVRSLEVTHGMVNSWHPHVHEIWFLERETTKEEYDSNFIAIKKAIFDLWFKACAYAGLGEPSWDHGVDVRSGTYAAKYVAKFGTENDNARSWGMEDELTKWGAKQGRKLGADGKPSEYLSNS